jgi:predicted Rdx family selenoprotein
MPRKRKPDQPKETDSTTTTMTVEPPIETQAAPVEPPLETSAEPLPVEQPTTFVERLGERGTRPATPDPFLIALDNVAGVRLFESKRDRVMAIKFDQKPAQAVIDVLKEAGFRWNPADHVWTQPVLSNSAMTTRIDAERLYQRVREMIRQDKGTGQDKDTGQDIPF